MPRLSHHEEMPGFPARPFASGALRDRSPRHGWLERRSYSASNRTADRLDDDIDAAETITSRPSPWPRRRSSIVPVGQSALGSGSRPERRPEPTKGLLVQVGPAPGAGLEGEEPDALAAIADGEGRTGACGGTRPCPGAGLWPRPRSRPVSPPPGAVTMTGCAGGHRWPRSFVTKRRTLAYRPGKPWSSTRSSQVAMALRPRARACPMSPRYSSRALAVGARLAGGARTAGAPGRRKGSRQRADSPDFGAGARCSAREADGRSWPPSGTLAASRRTPVAASMRGSGQPSRPNIKTGCCLWSPTMLAMSAGRPQSPRRRQRLGVLLPP